MSKTFADLLRELSTEHDRELSTLQKANDRELSTLQKEVQSLRQQIAELKPVDDEVPCERTPADGIEEAAYSSESCFAVSSSMPSYKVFEAPPAPDIFEFQMPARRPVSVHVTDIQDKSGVKMQIKGSKEFVKMQVTQPEESTKVAALDSSHSQGSGEGRPAARLFGVQESANSEASTGGGGGLQKGSMKERAKGSCTVANRSSEEGEREERWTLGSSGFSSYDFMENDANGYKHANELRKWFAFLDPTRKKFLTPKDIHSLILKVEGVSKKSLDWVDRTVESLNVTLSVMPNHCLKSVAGPVSDHYRSSGTSYATSPDVATDSDLGFPGFVELIIWDHFSQFATDVSAVLYIRDVLIKASVEELVEKASHLQMPKDIPQSPFALNVLEPIVALVVFANAVTIGLSQDYPWRGWYGMEIGFTSFFVSEVIIKVCICGICDHFWRGQDAGWNVFDLSLVLLALTDLILTENGQDNTIGDAMVIRMIRLARLTRLMRLIRLLRLRFFKELLLMIKGVIAGMRTLFWAFVLLLITMYVIAVALRQTDMEDDTGKSLFKSLGWSMFTVYTCFTGECTMLDGTPLPLLLFRRYAWSFAIPYTIANICIVFGMFNLIMAIFVENVNESSKQKRQLSNEEERAKVCRNLRDLIMKFGGMSSKMEAAARYASINKKRKNRRFRDTSLFVHASTHFSAMIRGTITQGLRATMSRSTTPMASQSTRSTMIATTNSLKSVSPTPTNHVHFQFGGQITRDVFQEVIADAEVQEMLDELDIHVGDRTEIFDVVDTELTGYVEVSDLVAGLLKLRSGGADKSDIVSAILGIRSMRKQMNTFMERVLDNQVQVFVKMDEQAQVLLDIAGGSRNVLPSPQRNNISARFSCASARCSTVEGFARESWYRPSCISIPPRPQKQPISMNATPS